MIRDRLRHLVRPGEWTLRGRLLGQLVALVAIACLVMGVVTTVGLRGYLLGKLDGQVGVAADRAMNTVIGPDGRMADPVPPDPRNQRPRVFGGNATVTLSLIDGNVRSAFFVDPQQHGEPQFRPLAASVIDTLVQAAATPGIHTVDLDGLGPYRVTGVPGRIAGQSFVVGLSMGEVEATVVSATWIMLAVALIVLLLTVLGGELIITYTLKPLRRVAATAGRVAELPLERGEVALSVRVPDEDTNPRTEVGQVGAALNRMLGHIANALAVRHASEMRVRKFVADASHELRTPLAAIRGYAELTRRSGDQVPPDIARAMGRVESESVRMTALVEDLLLLARLDAGRPLRRQPVDLTQLVVDSVSDAHVAGPDHKWRVDVPDEPVTVPGDEARLRQVLANLLANARTHTPPGTIVNVTVEADGGDVRLSVTDDGPGIPPELLPEVFERFARGDSSRSRAAGSTGLGLSIVAAVVSAHKGTVSVSSHPGHTEFSVQLPAI
ncbi:sensor histidine kinase [Fodinicola acaciae]|uniref:sensor histidine kinase n=1 Tax=Fodinicola acaciae TaxID=2681555 RepID=UPI001FE26C31|nr:HAMP domain-containing sensor histidine kinase [Fodinicola acaciae]